MTNTLTPDGAIILAALAAIVFCLLLYILVSGRRNGGVAVLPDFLLFGVWGFTVSPSLILVARSQRNNSALIAHERHHQKQQREAGALAFWWCYLTNRRERLYYELAAYAVWLRVAPQDRNKVVWWLTHNYDAGLPAHEIVQMLDLRLAESS